MSILTHINCFLCRIFSKNNGSNSISVAFKHYSNIKNTTLYDFSRRILIFAINVTLISNFTISKIKLKVSIFYTMSLVIAREPPFLRLSCVMLLRHCHYFGSFIITQPSETRHFGQSSVQAEYEVFASSSIERSIDVLLTAFKIVINSPPFTLIYLDLLDREELSL